MKKRAKLLFCNLNLLLFLPLTLPSPSPSLELLNHKTKRSTFSQSESAFVSLSGSYYRPKSVPDPHPEIKGGGGGGRKASRPFDKGGAVSNKNRFGLRASVMSKNKGRGKAPPRAPLLDPPLEMTNFPTLSYASTIVESLPFHVAEAEKGTLSG